MKLVTAIAVVLLVSGCATTMTPEGAGVQVVDGAPIGCRLLGGVNAFDTMSANSAAEYRSAMNEARNKAAKLGANTVTVVAVAKDQFGTSVELDAYKCPG